MALQFDYRLEHPATQPRILDEKFAGFIPKTWACSRRVPVHNLPLLQITIFPRHEHRNEDEAATLVVPSGKRVADYHVPGVPGLCPLTLRPVKVRLSLDRGYSLDTFTQQFKFC
jgi:hypothetical protein